MPVHRGNFPALGTSEGIEEDDVVYRPMRSAHWMLPALFAVFGAAAVGLVVATARGDGPPVLFAVLWLAAYAWNAYWWLWRTCVEIRVDGPSLSWATPLRRGSLPVADVVRIRASRVSRQVALIELREGRPLLVPVRFGFGELEREVLARAPAAVVDTP